MRTERIEDMENKTRKKQENMMTTPNPQNMPVPAEPFDLRQKAYEDAKKGVQDFENNHPGTVRKVVCTTMIGVAATAILDTVIVLTT